MRYRCFGEKREERLPEWKKNRTGRESSSRFQDIIPDAEGIQRGFGVLPGASRDHLLPLDRISFAESRNCVHDASSLEKLHNPPRSGDSLEIHFPRWRRARERYERFVPPSLFFSPSFALTRSRKRRDESSRATRLARDNNVIFNCQLLERA